MHISAWKAEYAVYTPTNNVSNTNIKNTKNLYVFHITYLRCTRTGKKLNHLNLSYKYLKQDTYKKNPIIFYYGGAKRDRTADLLNANQALSQLSYSPLIINGGPG